MGGTLRPVNYPLDVGGVDDYPVRVGSMLFTLVDPHRGYEVAYNRWYERDHYYAGCLIGPHLLAGSRWVSTRGLKDLRFPQSDRTVADPWDAGSYLAVYWIERDRHEDWNQWALDQVRWLYTHGRGFNERSHVHTVLFSHLGARYRDPDPVPVDLALDHRYPGLIVCWLDGLGGVDATELSTRLAAGPMPALLGARDTASPIAIASSWTPAPGQDRPQDAPMDLGSRAGGPERLVQLLFVDGDLPAATAAVRAYTDQVAADGLAAVRLVAPFRPTVVGTDRYTDELW
jgi:hypothetical protein